MQKRIKKKRKRVTKIIGWNRIEQKKKGKKGKKKKEKKLTGLFDFKTSLDLS